MEATSSASGGIREMVIYAYIEWDQSLLVKGYMRQVTISVDLSKKSRVALELPKSIISRQGN